MKLTLITVCFNSEATIADTLRSVDRQSGIELEHLIIDGASRDATLEIVAAHARPWRRVVSESDRGIYDAMNKGLRLATGEIIGFLNSDDFYASTDTLATVMAAFDDDLDACYGDLCYVKRDRSEEVVRYWRSSAFRPGLFLSGWCPPHPTLFVRRHIYERFGMFDPRFRIAADVELMARFMEVHRIRARYISQLIVKMRMGGASNHSLSNVVLQNREIWRAMTMHNLKPSVFPFLFGKTLARCRQFLSRPA